MAQQVEVTDRVEHLVLDELIVIAQATLVNDTIFIHHDGIVEATAQGEIIGAQIFKITHKAKSPRPGDLLDEGGGREVHHGRLLLLFEDRMVELDGKRDFEALVRQETCLLALLLDDYFALDANKFLRSILLSNARRLNQEYERAGTAIHDRHFRCTEIDIGIVDAQARKSRHQVLYGRYLDVILRQCSTQCRVSH